MSIPSSCWAVEAEYASHVPRVPVAQPHNPDPRRDRARDMLCEGAPPTRRRVNLHSPHTVTAAVAGLGYTTFAIAMTTVRMTGTTCSDATAQTACAQCSRPSTASASPQRSRAAPAPSDSLGSPAWEPAPRSSYPPCSAPPDVSQAYPRESASQRRQRWAASASSAGRC